MSRQSPRDAVLSGPAPERRIRRTGSTRRLPLATAGVCAVLAAGLLIGWNPPFSAAQQSPDTWSGEHRALLPSGLSVQLDFSPAPGTGVTAEPGELADRAGGGRSAALYTDGLRPGDPAETFRITEDRPQADGSWRTVGTLQLTFSGAVRNPRLHLSGLAAVATGRDGTTSTATRLTVTGGSPDAPTLVNRTDWPGWTVDGNSLAPAGADGASDGSGGSAAEGSLELAGTFRTAVLRVEQRSTARAGSTTAPVRLNQAYTVTVDEGVGTAPQGYGNASHLLSDLFLGAEAASPARLARRTAVRSSVPAPASAEGATPGADPADEPLVQLDHGAGRRSVWSSPAPPQLQPGRGEYQGADPSIGYPAEAAIGRYYRLTVPVAVGGATATLAGWVDFDRNGRFDATERVQSEVPAGADHTVLEWTVPAGASSGETWARLRIGRDAAQLVPPGGFADSGQVLDQRIRLTVGAARPEIAEPVDGAVVADARPQVRGEGAVSGATVEVRDGDATLCRAHAGKKGDWSCRPGGALSPGVHALTPVETTSGGVVLRGEPIRITVKTAPPAAPALTLPEYTNDPGLQLTGTGEAGSTVSVTDQPAGVRGAGVELCSTAVRSDGAWSCLPVENLTDGRHQLTPTAVDAAGNRTAGRATGLVVDTVAPARPVLTAPAAGETVRIARPKLAGRAEAGARVIVTARAGGSGPASDSASAERIVACGATAAIDGSWTCTANRDLPEGEQWLLVTATDLAGNGTSGDPVGIRVAAAVPVPSTPSPVVPSPSAAAPVTPPVTASPSVSLPVVPVPTVPPTAVPSPAVPTASVPTASVPTASVPASAVPSVSVPASAVPSPLVASPVPTSSVPVPSLSASAVPTPTSPAAVPASPAAASPIPTAPIPTAPIPTAPIPTAPSPSATVPVGSASPSVPSVPVLDPVAPGLLPVVVPVVVPPVAGPTPSSAPTVPVPSASVPSAPVPTVSPSVPVGSASPSVPSVPALDPVAPGLLPVVVPVVVPPVAAVPGRPAVPGSSVSPSVPGSPGVSVSPSVSAPAGVSGSSVSPSVSAPAGGAASPSGGLSAAPSPSPSPALSVSPSPVAASAAAGPVSAAPAPVGPVSGDPEVQPAAESSRALAAPPGGAVAAETAADRPGSGGWRGALAGFLLLLTGIGLITRRVFARGPGARRR
ncbi:Ig-like domain-containing protein [Kitasatospora sp. NPDC048239]|uniref:Ig-like domain-containing protein n=1 Tax=Kitasatospora sp. NPDC048239 TaxID=3364046 RepID=UPI003717D42C